MGNGARVMLTGSQRRARCEERMCLLSQILRMPVRRNGIARDVRDQTHWLRATIMLATAAVMVAATATRLKTSRPVKATGSMYTVSPGSRSSAF